MFLSLFMGRIVAYFYKLYINLLPSITERMAKSTSRFVCQHCGTLHTKWAGKCDDCGEWDTLVEEVVEQTPKGLSATAKGKKLAFVRMEDSAQPLLRIHSGMEELNRVLGGGLVPGSAVLIGGDPGIGKSTLLLQLVASLSAAKTPTAYISGEESVAQIQLRAKRLGLKTPEVQLAASNSVRDIIHSLDGAQAPEVVIIDSIQTMFIDSIDSAPGTVAQVRACSNELIKLAKRRNLIMLLVGHVTKDGQIAGPRVMEHMVDTVLYFEGDRGHQYRILRSVKNRFGATDEIGVFAMTDAGLTQVENPSSLFLSERDQPVSGSVVFAGMEGSRPLLVEVQALVAPSPLATPRRSTVGWDSNRLAMVLAVLEARCGVRFSDKEIYLNVAGGLKITEPAADLAVAAALLSALADIPVKKQSVWFGEIGLSGEVRAVGRSELRVKEAHKLGFGSVFCPSQRQGTAKSKSNNEETIALYPIGHLQELVALLGQTVYERGEQRVAVV